MTERPPLVIDELWAWVSLGPDGDEGLLAAPTLGPGSLVPLVGADKERMESLRPLAQAMADAFGVNANLLRFSSRELLEHLEPDRPERP